LLYIEKHLFIFVIQSGLNMRQLFSKSNLRFFLIPFLVLLMFVRCDDNETAFPNVSVNVYLSLDTQLGNMLIDSYKFIDGHGVGGLIIYRKDHHIFMAFDRACRHEASRDCIVEEHPEFTGILQCTCCESEYWMTGIDLAGSIKQGPAKAPLMQYNCYFDGTNTIRVTN